MAAVEEPPKQRAPVRISIEQAIEIARKHERQNEVLQARALYAQILRSFPGNVQAQAGLQAIDQAGGPVIDPPSHLTAPLMALAQRKENSLLADEALKLLRDYPKSFLLWSLLGSASFDGERLDLAEKCARKAVALLPNSAAGHFNLASALRAQQKFDEALGHFSSAAKLDPRFALAHHHCALILFEKGDTGQALAAWDEAIRFGPNMALAHCGRGIALSTLARHEEAISAFQKAIELNPALVDAYDGLGSAYCARGYLKKAIDAFDHALSLKPEIPNAATLSHWLRMQICDLTATADVELRDDLNAFEALGFEDSPGQQLKRSRLAWSQIAKSVKPKEMRKRPVTRPKKLRIGYFSADFHDHATMHLMFGMFRLHDRSRFDINIYSYGTQKVGQFRDMLLNTDVNFHDIEPLDDPTSAELARSHELDIAIDLKGYTTESRCQLFAYRLAPVQISFLAYPATMGSDVFDYIVADQTVIPKAQRKYYSERILQMPHSYQPNDNERRAAPSKTTRSQFGLPADGIVFCNFNNSYKIGPKEFDVWMRILGRVERSVLWLLRSNEWMEGNLRKEAEARGVSPDRIVFCDRELHALHLARHKHADLFLDTFNYNAHTTASDALWSGVPIVTKAGKQFAARVAASLLNAVGLPDLITKTERQYEEKIVELVTHHDRLQEVKERLKRNLATFPLFDTERYTRNFEAGLELAYDRYFTGKQPADIAVPDFSGR